MTPRKRKVAKPTMAWCALYRDAGGPVIASLNIKLNPLTYIAFLSRREARVAYPDHRIARVEIREVKRKTSKRRAGK